MLQMTLRMEKMIHKSLSIFHISIPGAIQWTILGCVTATQHPRRSYTKQVNDSDTVIFFVTRFTEIDYNYVDHSNETLSMLNLFIWV